jgi:hypothetical protein
MLDFSRRSIFALLFIMVLLLSPIIPVVEAHELPYDEGFEVDAGHWLYSSGITRENTNPKVDSYSLYANADNEGGAYGLLSETELYSGAWVYMDEYPDGVTLDVGRAFLLSFGDGTSGYSGTFAGITLNGDGKIWQRHKLASGSWGTDSYIGKTISLDTWYYFEIYWKSATEFEVKINGNVEYNSVDVATKTITWAGLGFTEEYCGYADPHTRNYFDEFHVGTTSGAPVFLTYWYIDASAGAGGTIDPDGLIAVVEGDGEDFDITPNLGYEIDDVLVNSVSVGNVTHYDFINVVANATIEATFKAIAVHWFIDSSTGVGGTIDPVGLIDVVEGDDQTFNFTANTHYIIDDVLVDSVSQGNVTSYQFVNVVANHTISVSFTFVPYFTIASSAGIGGTITPLGNTLVDSGDSQNYTFSANFNYVISDVVLDGVTHVGAVSYYNFVNVVANRTIIVLFAYVPPPTITVLRPEYVPVGTNVIGGGNDQQTAIVTPTGYLYTVGVKPYDSTVIGYRTLVINWVAPDGIAYGYDELTLSYGLIGWVGSGPEWTITGLSMVQYSGSKVIISCGVWRGGVSGHVVPVVFTYEAGSITKIGFPASYGCAPSTGFGNHFMGAYDYTPTVTGARGDAGVQYYRFVYAGDYFGTLRVTVVRYRPDNGEVIISTLTDDYGPSPSVLSGGFEDPLLKGVYYLVSIQPIGDSSQPNYWILNLNATVPSLYWDRVGYEFSAFLSPYYTGEAKFLGGGIDTSNAMIYYNYLYSLGVGYTQTVIRQERFLFHLDIGFYPYVIDSTEIIDVDCRSYGVNGDNTESFVAIDGEALDYRTFTVWSANSTSWTRRLLSIPDWTTFSGCDVGGFDLVAEYSQNPYWMTPTDEVCGRVVIPYPVGTPLYGFQAVIDHARNPTDAIGTSQVYYESVVVPTTPSSGVFDLFFVQANTPPDVKRRVSTTYDFTYTVTDNFGIPYAGHDFNITMTHPDLSVFNATIMSDGSGIVHLNNVTADVSWAMNSTTIHISGDNTTGGINDHTFTINWFPNVVLTAITVTPVGGPYVGTAYTYHTYVTVDGVPFVGTVNLIKDGSYPAVATDVTADGHGWLVYTQPIVGTHTFRAEVTVGVDIYDSNTVSKVFTIYVPPPPPPWWQNLPLILAFIVSIIPVFILLLTTTGIGYLALNTIHGAILGFNLGVGIGIAISIIPLYFVAVCLIVDVGAFYLIGIGVDE